MKRYLVKLADHLDKKGLRKEADYVDWILKRAEETDYDKLMRQREESNKGLETLDQEIRVDRNAKKNAGTMISRLKQMQSKLIEGSVNIEELQSFYFENNYYIPCHRHEATSLGIKLLDNEMQMKQDIEHDATGSAPKFKRVSTIGSVIAEFPDLCVGGSLKLKSINQLASMQNDAVMEFNRIIESLKRTNTGKYIERSMGGLNKYKAKKAFLTTPQNLFD